MTKRKTNVRGSWFILWVAVAASIATGGACQRRAASKGGASGGLEGDPSCLETNPRSEVAATCMACLTKTQNASKEGCCGIKDAVGRQLCEKAAACMRAGGPPVGPCNIAGDTTTCFCGSHSVSCWERGVPNGPCIAAITAAAGRNVDTLVSDSPNEDTILQRYGDIKYALGRASNIASIAGAFCANECEIAKN